MNKVSGHISINMDATSKREAPNVTKRCLERQNAVKHITMEEALGKNSVSPIKYDMRTSRRSLFSLKEKRDGIETSLVHSFFGSATTVDDCHQTSKYDKENTMVLEEKEYMPVLRQLCEEYKVRMKKEQYKDAESAKTAKQILYGYMKENDVKNVANIL